MNVRCSLIHIINIRDNWNKGKRLNRIIFRVLIIHILSNISIPRNTSNNILIVKNTLCPEAKIVGEKNIVAAEQKASTKSKMQILLFLFLPYNNTVITGVNINNPPQIKYGNNTDKRIF